MSKKLMHWHGLRHVDLWHSFYSPVYNEPTTVASYSIDYANMKTCPDCGRPFIAFAEKGFCKAHLKKEEIEIRCPNCNAWNTYYILRISPHAMKQAVDCIKEYYKEVLA